jgi:hypothetical protein
MGGFLYIEAPVTEDNQPPKIQESVTELMNEVHRKHERLKRNRQNVAYATTMLPYKEKLLAEAMKSLEYYQKLVPELANDISLLRKRLEFSLKFCAEHDDDNEEMKEAEKIAAKIKKLEKELIRLREIEAEKNKTDLSPNVGE